jgi:DNA repair exonuclease SbcCD nuclease subunit
MDIADLHIGHPDFDEEALRDRLKQAVERGVEAVFIAGDIFEGFLDEAPETMPYLQQIELAYSIFKDYKLTYYAINGNHDLTFEQLGLPNPIKRLEVLLRNDGIDFHFFDTYLMDFVICGVIKRVMHVERQDFNKKSIFAILKLKMFDEAGMLSNEFEGTSYPVRFFQVGHIHVNVQMYYSKRKVFISQPGSFIRADKVAERANFIFGKVIDQRVFMG